MRTIAENYNQDIKNDEKEQEVKNRFTGEMKKATRNAAKAAKNATAAKKAKKAVNGFGGKVLKFVLAHLPVFLPILIAAIIFIYLIGIVGFISSAPGMFMSNLLSGAKSLWHNIYDKVWNEVTGEQRPDKDEVKELAQYLQNMGYSVQGYGYADVKYTDETDSNDAGNTKEIEKVTHSIFKKNNLEAYLAANEATYALSNDSVLGEVQYLRDKFFNGEEAKDSSGDYSTGLINLSGIDVANTDDGLISKLVGDQVQDSALRSLRSRLYIDRDNECLTIYTTSNVLKGLQTTYGVVAQNFGILGKISSWFANFVSTEAERILRYGTSYSYDLSDWTARYGRPTEMFIALHNATMMPDLVYQIATGQEFNTKVDIQFQTTTVTVEGLRIVKDNTEYTESEIEKAYVRYLEDEIGEEDEELKDANGNVIGIDYEARRRNEAREELKGTIESIMSNAEDCKKLMEALYTEGVDKDGVTKIDLVETVRKAGFEVSSLITGDDRCNVELPDDDEDLKNIIITKGGENEEDNSKNIKMSEVLDNITQLQELMNIFHASAMGIQDVELPYIASVRHHWFYDDINFSKSTNNDGKGVYNTAAKARKTVSYINKTEEKDDPLNNLEIKMDVVYEAVNEEGIYYQVNEPIVSGPNENIVNVFNQSYYKYDGNESTAERIAIAKQLDESKSNSSYQFGGEKHTISKENKDAYESGTLAQKQKPSFGSASDTLSAFSILDNVHTSAAESVYRMLKELATSEEIEGSLEEGSLNTDLMLVLLWPFKDGSGTATKDDDEYGIKISEVEGKEVIAPGDGEIVSSSGDSVTIKFGVLSEELVELLEYIYEGEFYNIDSNIVNGMTMTIKGINSSASGTVSRGDTIGTANSDEIQIVMQHMDKSLVGEGESTDDDVEDYMSPEYTYEIEEAYKIKKANRKGVADENATPTYRGDDANFNPGDDDEDSDNDDDNDDNDDDGEPVVDFTADEIAWKIWCALREAGYSEEAAAGVLGNIYQESRFDPTASNSVSGGHYGLAQWGGSRFAGLKELAADNGKKGSNGWQDVDTQVQYLVAEIDSNGKYHSIAQNTVQPGAYKEWKQAKTPEKAAELFLKWFERAGADEAALGTRQKMARKYYNKFKGKSTDGGTSTSEEKVVNGQIGYTETFKVDGKTFYGWKQYPLDGSSGHNTFERWMKKSGCGLTSAAIILSSKDSSKYTPAYLWNYEHGRGTVGEVRIGTYLSDAGCKYTQGVDYSQLKSGLANGKQAIVCLNGGAKVGGIQAGSSGHYVTILSSRESNGKTEVYVSDPGHAGTSGWMNIENFKGKMYSGNTYLVDT